MYFLNQSRTSITRLGTQRSTCGTPIRSELRTIVAVEASNFVLT